MKVNLLSIQIEIYHKSKTDRGARRYKTIRDKHPWLTSRTCCAFGYHITLLRRISNYDDFLTRKFIPDSDRQPSLFQKYPPPPPHVVLANLEEYKKQITIVTYVAPPGQKDTPLRALYRLYEYVIMDQNICMRNELEYFWYRRNWFVHKIADPKDPDPARYAMLAGVADLLVLSFNRRIGIGLPRDAPRLIHIDDVEKLKSQEKKWERLPGWALRVPPLQATLRIPAEGALLEDCDIDKAAKYLREKNILLLQPHIHFI